MAPAAGDRAPRSDGSRRYPRRVPRARPASPSAPAEEVVCPLCERRIHRPSRHHLVPASEGGRHGPTVVICGSCHGAVHAILDNRTIARELRSVEALRAHPALRGTFGFIGRQPPERAVRTRRSRDRGRRRR